MITEHLSDGIESTAPRKAILIRSREVLDRAFIKPFIVFVQNANQRDVLSKEDTTISSRFEKNYEGLGEGLDKVLIRYRLI